MANALLEIVAERISSGLKRSTIMTASSWAENYRVMSGSSYPGPWRFDYHPWLKQMHDSESSHIVGMKAAQMGYTETALNLTFKKMDIDGDSVLYLLPSQNPDATDFSASRFDPALELSPHLKKIFTSTKNVGHKRAGNSSLFVRGIRSRKNVKSLPVSFIVFDEVDEMLQENITLAFERMSGQTNKQAMLISTPTIEDVGIHSWFRFSTQNEFFFMCPSCNKWIDLVFPDSVVITGEDLFDPKLKDTHLICRYCKAILPHASKHEWLSTGKWVEGYNNRDYDGFHINQLYSYSVSPYEIACLYLKSITNPTDEQEFFNSKLGIPHAVEGARVTLEHIKKCTGNYLKVINPTYSAFRTLGVDVGKNFHYEIDEWSFDQKSHSVNNSAKCKVILEGKTPNIEEIERLMRDYQINFCVMDANPERRVALNFCQKFYGNALMCFYNRGITGKTIQKKSEEPAIGVDRTSWLDLSLSRFMNGTIRLPKDVSLEYKENIQAITRVYDKDLDGNPIGSYVSSKNDHHAHARNYAEMALALGCSMGVTYNIRSGYN